jgi:hypothetical protein
LIQSDSHWEPSKFVQKFYFFIPKIKDLEVEMCNSFFNTNLVLNKCSASAQVIVLATSTLWKNLVAITCKTLCGFKLKNNIECYQNNPFAQINFEDWVLLLI